VPRDESYYFRAGQDYAAWYVDVWKALEAGEPGRAFSDQAIVRRFEYNHEHPVLTKVAFGLSHLLFTQKLGWTSDAGGFRLPAWAFSGLLSALLYLMASRLTSRRGGLSRWRRSGDPAAVLHGHLACFDVPIASMWLLTAYATGGRVEPR
jgi:predicted membrane-bound dolichyl-phosphate-mannose-protein mannosyltransferase